MNHKSLSALILLGAMGSVYADRDVTPTIINRSQGRDAALKVAGLSEKVHLYNEGNYINLDGTVAFGRSFRAQRLAECLFGDDLINCQSIKIQGSDVANRDPKAWLADYFYLPPDYDSDFSIDPRVQTALLNLDLYVGLDELLEGLYFRIHGPITWSRWDINFNELCDQNFTGSFREGYFTWDGMDNDQLLKTFGDYASGKSPLNTSGFQTDGSFTNQLDIGVSFETLNFAKIERCSRSRTGFAEVRFELGYDFFQSDDYHLGLNVQVAAPSGSRRMAEFAFDPTIGNGNHWEVGAGVSAHYILWRAQAEDKFAGFYLDASITHINNGKEERTFDLCGRPNSRYMLAEKMGNPVNFLRAGDTTGLSGTTASTTVPNAQFKGIFTPVANLTTVDVNVRATIQADVAAMINYTTNSWGFDVGYNFWIRSCEKISLPRRPTSECCPNLCTTEKDMWALKGDAAVFGFMSAVSGNTAIGQLNVNEPVPLSATQCGSTIHKGTNADADITDCLGVDSLQNCGVDNPKFAYGRGTSSAGGNDDQLLVHSTNTTIASDAIKTSLDPKFINCCDINFQRTRGLSHKVFVNANYTWDFDNWSPYFGIGGAVEFAGRTSNDNCQVTTPDCSVACDTSSCCTTDCSCCLTCSLSQWQIWLKGGINFN